MTPYRICVLPGDGIGPEVTAAAVRVIEAAAARRGFAVAIDEQPFGGAAIELHGDPFPDPVREACLASDAVLLGAVGGPRWDNGGPRPEQGLMSLRKALDAYANLRPVRRWSAAAASPLRQEVVDGIDLLIVRELTGGLYFGERARTDTGAYDTMAYDCDEIRRVLRIAFRRARERRRRLTSVDKANVLETSRVWRELAEEVGRDYPDVVLEHQLVDSMTMRLVEQPGAFDVVVTENLFGDILSDLAASIAGGIGLAPSASLGDGRPGLFEPVHGSAPDIAGTGTANPAGACLSAAMLLRELGEGASADDVERAVVEALAAGPVTADLGGAASTAEVTDAIVRRLAGAALDAPRSRAGDGQALRASVKAQVRHFASDFAALDRLFPGVYPRMIVRGEGAYLYDDTGHRTLDAGVSLGVCAIGHGRRTVSQAVAEQIERLDFVGLEAGLSHEPVARLAAELAPLLPFTDAGLSFTTSGSEANDLAFKLARAYWHARGEAGRYKIVARHTSYHGASFGGLSATGSPPFRAPFEPIVPGFVRTAQPSPGRCGFCAFGDTCTLACADDLERVVVREGPSSVAAFIGEPVSIFGAAKVPHPGYWPRVRAICDAYGVLLIDDEVVTGFGRTGRMFGIAHWDVEPDLTTMAKGLTSGYVPMGAAAVGPRVQEVLGGTPLMHINTYAGHPAACAAALATLRITRDERLVENAAALEPVVQSALEEIAARCPAGARVSALGLMTGIEVVVPAADHDLASRLRGALYERGLAARVGVADGLASVLFYPPLTIDREVVREGMAALADGLETVGLVV